MIKSKPEDRVSEIVKTIKDTAKHPAGIEQLPAISPEFAARLDHLGAGKKVRAIVMLQTDKDNKPKSEGPSRQQRAEMLEQIRQTARAALPLIDIILDHYQGARMSKDVDALGSIVVEAPADGIRALADCEYVKAIVEDQSIFQIP